MPRPSHMVPLQYSLGRPVWYRYNTCFGRAMQNGYNQPFGRCWVAHVDWVIVKWPMWYGKIPLKSVLQLLEYFANFANFIFHAISNFQKCQSLAVVTLHKLSKLTEQLLFFTLATTNLYVCAIETLIHSMCQTSLSHLHAKTQDMGNFILGSMLWGFKTQ